MPYSVDLRTHCVGPIYSEPHLVDRPETRAETGPGSFRRPWSFAGRSGPRSPAPNGSCTVLRGPSPPHHRCPRPPKSKPLALFTSQLSPLPPETTHQKKVSQLSKSPIHGQSLPSGICCSFSLRASNAYRSLSLFVAPPATPPCQLSPPPLF